MGVWGNFFFFFCLVILELLGRLCSGFPVVATSGGHSGCGAWLLTVVLFLLLLERGLWQGGEKLRELCHIGLAVLQHVRSFR